MVRRYISYGAGVGSTSLILHMLEDVKKGKIEVVFVNHGCDYPENYEYVKYIQNELDISITEIIPKMNTTEGVTFNNLFDYYLFKKLYPSIINRSCTYRAKIRPIARYINQPCYIFLGLTYDERKRKEFQDHDEYRKGTKMFTPLIDQEITRDIAIEMIKEQGLKVPIKSGCYFCPFQSIEQWRLLFLNHRDLFEKAVLIEENAKTRNPNITLLPKKSLSKLGEELRNQNNLDEFFGDNNG